MANVTSIFDIKPHVISRNLKGYSFLFYGEKKSGKTTTACRFKKHILFGAEKGWNSIPNAMAIPINNWSEAVKYQGQLLKDAKDVEKGLKEETTFETVIIDTADLMWSYCEKYICSINGVTKLDDSEGKCAYKQLEKCFEDWFLALIKAGYTVIFISHAQETQVKDPKTGEKTTKIVTTLEKRCAKVITRAVDIMAYARANYDSEGKVVTTLRLRGTPEIECGSRFKYQSEEIPFTYEALRDDIFKAIEKQEQEAGVTSTKEVSNLFVEENKERTYEEVMADVNKIGKRFHKAGKLSDMNMLVEKRFGTGFKISTATQQQKDGVEAVLVELENLADELGI